MDDETIQNLADDVVTAIAILAIAALGYLGITDIVIVGGIAGLGGYNLLKHRQGEQSN